MKNNLAIKRTCYALLVILSVFLVFSSGIFGAYQIGVQQVKAQSTPLPYTVSTYGSAWDGIIAYGVNNHLVVMRTDGTIIDQREGSGNYGIVKNVAQDTLLFQGEPQTTTGANSAPIYAAHIWNVATNTTQDYPNVLSHHDIEYDPAANTFLGLQEYVKQIGVNSYLMDKIVELDTQGNVLWSWDVYDHIPLSQISPLNETSIIGGQTVMDFTHANALLWEPNNNIIYLNARNMNTFYKINQTTGDIIWSCGQFGNFTLVDQNNVIVPSLWYHSHHLQQIAPNVFTMFNNDFGNITNYNDDNSQMIQFSLNMQNMTAKIDWSWTAPSQYYSLYLGAVWKLPNGDWLGDFGPPTHQFPQNQPWNFNNTGAVLIEVNPAGQIMRTTTFATQWSIYRIGLVTNLSQNAFSYLTLPSPTPIPNYTIPETSQPVSPTLEPSQSQSPSPSQTATSTPINTPSPTQQSPTNPQDNTILILLIAGLAVLATLLSIAYIKKQKLYIK
jgi:hypothetical protein